MFLVAPSLELKKLEALFRHEVFRVLLAEGKITAGMIAMLSRRRHAGFHVYCGNRISPDDVTALENLARYIVRASFSQERMQYLDQEGKVDYSSKDGKTHRVFPALEWLAALCSHIPNPDPDRDNVSRGKRQIAKKDDAIPCILEPAADLKARRRNWARLIKNIAACPREGGDRCGSSAASKTRR